VTAEPFAGHFGIGGLPGGEKLLTMFFKKEGITARTGVAFEEVTGDRIKLTDGSAVPFRYAMVVPSCCRNGSRSPAKAYSMTAAASANTVICQGASKASSPSRRGRSRSQRTSLGAHSRATPIIESRVAGAASSASVLPSVPGGRWGETR
jgi:hypothetical protein